MSDLNRANVTRFVYEQLRNRSFRSKLKVTSSEGATPIVVALPSDPTSTLLSELDAVGGAANVVLPVGDGVLIFGMHQADGDDTEDIPTLTERCTVGVFLARVVSDGGRGRYKFRGLGSDHESGRAELLGLAS